MYVNSLISLMAAYKTPSTDNRLPSTVVLKKGDLTDSARNDRIVPYKAYYPDTSTGETFPVILWSHGFGGSRDGASFLSRFLAGHGYVVIHITHAGTDSSLWEGKPGHPWDILKKTKVDRETTLNRFLDVPFVIDQLPSLDIAALMDTDHIGMSGHSFGALSSQVAAGQLFPDENAELQSYADARIKAGIAYSPIEVSYLEPDTPDEHPNLDDVYSHIDIPMLYMTGTEDSSPISGRDYTHRISVFERTGHAHKYMLIKDGGDHMVYNGTRGKLRNSALREKHEELICEFALKFWDATLKNDPLAHKWLDDQGAQDYIKGHGKFIAH